MWFDKRSGHWTHLHMKNTNSVLSIKQFIIQGQLMSIIGRLISTFYICLVHSLLAVTPDQLSLLISDCQYTRQSGPSICTWYWHMYLDYSWCDDMVLSRVFIWYWSKIFFWKGPYTNILLLKYINAHVRACNNQYTQMTN